jgi:hypothetical protein
MITAFHINCGQVSVSTKGITMSDLTDDQLQTGINLIQSFEDIFAKDYINIGSTHVKHRIG